MKSTEGLRGRNHKSKRMGGTKSMVRHLVARKHRSNGQQPFY